MTSTLPAAPPLAPGEDGYAAAATAVFNVARVPRPDLVVDATGHRDVVAAVGLAREQGRRVSVLSTGHGLPDDLAGTLAVRVRGLDDVRVDPDTATAVVGGGATWDRLVAAAAPHGLMPICGSSSRVGVSGFLLGGGHGPLSRTFGVGSDHLRRVRMVTADGVERDVDAARDPELFAALRGGKLAVGVVTELEIGLVPLARLYGGGLFLPGDLAPAVLPAWRDWVAGLPEEASSSIALLRLPADPSLPPMLQGRFVVHVRFAFTGDAADGEALFAPIRALAGPAGSPTAALADLVGEMPAAAIDAIHSDPTEPMPATEASALLGELPDAALDALLAVAGPGREVPLVMVELRALGGAIDRPAPEGDCVAGRGAAFSLLAIAPMVPELAAVAPVVTGAVTDALAPWAVGVLPNFGGSALPAHDPAVRARLDAVVARVDPDELFAR